MDELILAELERIRKQNGGLILPEVVVKEAEPEDSPLHDKFTWDDGIAGHAYRLEEARRFIRIYVNVVATYDGPKKLRMFVSLRQDRTMNGGYRELKAVLSDKKLRAQLKMDAYEDIRLFSEKFFQKYAALPELHATRALLRRAAKAAEPQRRNLAVG